jgi:hypothetical protein
MGNLMLLTGPKQALATLFFPDSIRRMSSEIPSIAMRLGFRSMSKTGNATGDHVQAGRIVTA